VLELLLELLELSELLLDELLLSLELLLDEDELLSLDKLLLECEWLLELELELLRSSKVGRSGRPKIRIPSPPVPFVKTTLATDLISR